MPHEAKAHPPSKRPLLKCCKGQGLAIANAVVREGRSLILAAN